MTQSGQVVRWTLGLPVRICQGGILDTQWPMTRAVATGRAPTPAIIAMTKTNTRGERLTSILPMPVRDITQRGPSQSEKHRANDQWSVDVSPFWPKVLRRDGYWVYVSRQRMTHAGHSERTRYNESERRVPAAQGCRENLEPLQAASCPRSFRPNRRSARTQSSRVLALVSASETVTHNCNHDDRTEHKNASCNNRTR